MEKLEQSGERCDALTGSIREERRALMPDNRDITLIASIFIASVISLGEVSLTITTLRNITLLVSVLYILATLVYQNRYTVNLEKGKRSGEYVNAYAEYDRLRCELVERGIVSRLPEFCARYCADELKRYREGLLAEVSLTYEDYEERYAQASSADLKSRYRLSPRTRRAIIRCQRAKALKLNKNMIILNDGDAAYREKPFMLSSRKRQSRDYTANMVSRVLITLLSGAVAVSFLVEPSLESLVQWCVRMVPIVSAAFVGASSGYLNGTETAPAYLRAQIIKIKEFLEWNEKIYEAK